MKIEIGEYEVYSSGTLITNLNEELVKFHIEDLYFEFLLKDDTSNKEQYLKASAINDKKGVRLEFINFNNSLGSGNTTPIRLAQIKNKSLHLNFRIYAMIGDKGVSGKTIHYTWLTKNIANESESK